MSGIRPLLDGDDRTAERDSKRRRVRVAAVQLMARGVDEAVGALSDSIAAVREGAERGGELVVVPECTWPGYVIGSDWKRLWSSLAPQEEVLSSYAALAQELGVVLVAGLALREGDVLRNSAVVWDRDGTEAGRVSKRFLWDFDSTCFAPATESPVVETSVGRLGVMVCADGRMPEIARLLAVGGAEILLDPTAWVTSEPDPQRWSNPQFEFMLPTRARENGLWSVAANKVGVERDAVAYCGRSCVVDSSGALVATAPSDEPAVVVSDCELAPSMLPVEARPELYGNLAADFADLPVAHVLAEPLVPSAATGRVAIDAMARPLDAADLELVRDLAISVLVCPRSDADVGTAPCATLQAIDADRAALTVSGVRQAVWERTHGPRAPGQRLGPVVDSPLGRLGVLLDDDGTLPEPARALMLQGAELLVWFPPAGEDVTKTAATRAAENRVNLVLAAPFGAATPAAVLSPEGAQVAAICPGGRIVHAVLSRAEVCRKEMAPGTDVVAGRQPSTYGALVKESS